MPASDQIPAMSTPNTAEVSPSFSASAQQTGQFKDTITITKAVPTEFHRFPDLPAELRLQILNSHSPPTPRTIGIRFRWNNTKSKWVKHITCFNGPRIPPMLHISQAYRSLALGSYVRFFGVVHIGRQSGESEQPPGYFSRLGWAAVYIDFAKDIIDMDGSHISYVGLNGLGFDGDGHDRRAKLVDGESRSVEGYTQFEELVQNIYLWDFPNTAMINALTRFKQLKHLSLRKLLSDSIHPKWRQQRLEKCVVTVFKNANRQVPEIGDWTS
ncbi:hypothetical protein GLAREA_04758 [Glarea lozoyensis ATCC 20868]|uniref:2EXR domain-containing protein n=1 Tax=Glarea lozoyensis (strain ATCC 20868 / MF5171) TaxID=1116229 RepID=S3CNA8_GLAL2|nr:uncharacterized protein GLAREA_04758 [Glarea lozoyensis ATCC 20868]EPE27967.1 hypothetical protein GLAREA_04758 [Glarea lozoyensis ATCC 20868]